ncbi:MAG: hypothetical protein AB7F35_01035 [Acetobacteraceae bacterium]
MRFKPHQRSEFTDTARKRANVLRRQRLERDALPLFADLIAERQPSVDAVMQKRADDWVRFEQEQRDHRAAQWRKARRRLYAYGDNIRPVLLSYWNQHRWLPGDPVYLLDMCHMFDRGTLHELDTFKAALGEPGSHVERIGARGAGRGR